MLDRVPGYVNAYEGDEDKFFTATEDEIKQIYKAQAKKDRKRRGVGLKIFLTIVIIIVILVVGAAVGYIFGFGFPTQEMTTEELFTNPTTTSSAFSSSVGESSKKQMVDSLVTDPSVEVTGVARDMNESKVYATAKTEQGGEMKYLITMKRELIGWKVSNVELYFSSQNS